MITEAIRSLKEEGGSTEWSISEYIKSNFDGLPPAHDRFLPYYLNKLTAEAVFARRPDGRYLVARGDAAQEEPDEAQPNLDRIAESNADNDDPRGGGGGVEDIGVADPSQEPETHSPQINDADIDADASDVNQPKDDEGVPIACDLDLVIEVQPPELSLLGPTEPKNGGGVGPGSTPKRKRSHSLKADIPRKRKHISVGSSLEATVHDDKDDNRGGGGGDDGVADPSQRPQTDRDSGLNAFIVHEPVNHDAGINANAGDVIQPRSEGVYKYDEGVPIACDGDLVIEVQPEELCLVGVTEQKSHGGGGSGSIPKRRGPPPQRRRPCRWITPPLVGV